MAWEYQQPPIPLLEEAKKRLAQTVRRTLLVGVEQVQRNRRKMLEEQKIWALNQVVEKHLANPETIKELDSQIKKLKGGL